MRGHKRTLPSDSDYFRHGYACGNIVTTEHAHNPENDWLQNALGKNLERDLERDLGQDPQQTLRGQSRENILWDIGVDTGGTFTDCVARHVDGRVARSKVLSTSALRGVVRGGGRGPFWG